MYNALMIARYIVNYCSEHNSTVSNLKLQKMLYFVQAEFLVDKGEPCFLERIEAWDFGPVVPEVYRAYKVYGSANIPNGFLEKSSQIKSDDKNRIDAIVDQCMQYSASQLVEITHHQSPWVEAYRRGWNNEITLDSIESYFSEGS